MRRFRIIPALIILLLACALPVSGAEAGQFRSAGDLWEHWCQTDSIPDFITGIWSTDGTTENLTFGVVPGQEGETAKNWILSRITDDSTVTFVTQTYSRNYLWAIMEDVNTYFDLGLGFMSAGPSEYDNVVYVELHTDYENNPDSLTAVAELTEKYGDAISVSFTDTVYVTTLESVTPPDPFLLMPAPKKAVSPLPVLVFLCLILGCVILMTERKRQLLLTGGGIAEISAASIEQQIRNTVPAVPGTLDDRIMESIAASEE